MFSFRLFGKNFTLHALDLLFILFALSYLFSTYSPWLQNQCIATVTADVNHDLSYYYSFTRHLKEHQWWYPIDYTRDNDGFYWYFVLPIPYFLPYLLTLFLPFHLSFFFFYVLFYFFLVVAIYFFLLHFASRLIALLMAGFLLVGPFLNLIFSVGGNYHFFIGLTFFILTLHFFYHFLTHQKKTHLLLFTISFFLLGASYYFSLLLFLLFAIVHLLVTKNYKLLLYVLVLTGTLSIFLVPTTIQTLTFEEKTQLLPLKELLSTHVLPKHGLTSWIYMENPPYDSTRDQNHGPQIYLAGLLSIGLLVFLYRDKSPIFLFLLTAFLVYAALLLIPFTTTIIPSERFMVHVYLSLFFLLAYTLSKLHIHFYPLILLLLLGFAVTNKPILASQFFTFTLLLGLALAYLIWKKDYHALSFHHGDLFGILVNALLLFLLLFPLTGKVEGTTLHPRPNHFLLDGIEQAISPNDTIFSNAGYTMGFTIHTCAQSSGVLPGGASRDAAISKQKEINLFNSSQETRDLIHFKDITKIIVPLELTQTNGQIDPAKVRHLAQWFGNPALFNAQFRTFQGLKLLGQTPYPLLIFNVPQQPKNYALEKITPIRLQLTKKADARDLIINIQYHPWWRATANGKPLSISNNEGYVSFQNVRGITTIDLRFSMFYFSLGRSLSLFALLFVLLLYRRYAQLPETRNLKAWIHAIKSLFSRR